MKTFGNILSISMILMSVGASAFAADFCPKDGEKTVPDTTTADSAKKLHSAGDASAIPNPDATKKEKK